MKILIIEDEKIMLNQLVTRFTNEHFDVIFAKDGKLGLDMAISEKPELILLDIVLPKMDGMTMMSKLRQSNSDARNVPIILLTNLNSDEKIMKGIIQDNPSYYLVKTEWTLDDIVEKVKDTLKMI